MQLFTAEQLATLASSLQNEVDEAFVKAIVANMDPATPWGVAWGRCFSYAESHGYVMKEGKVNVDKQFAQVFLNSCMAAFKELGITKP